MANFITKGSFAQVIQPGWIIEDDGFGLLTSRVIFINDTDKATGAPNKLDPHPFDNRLQCHKVSYTVNSAKRCVITADYVGIASGAETTGILTADYSGSTQSIQAHPKFARDVGYNGADKMLKEYGWDGFKFDEEDADAIASGLVGTKNFVVGEMSINFTWYTTTKSILEYWVNAVGKTVEKSSNASASDVILPTVLQPISGNHDRFVLVSNVSYEKYAHLYKINVVFRVATGGWHKYVYERAP